MNDDNIPDIKKRLNKINNLISESNINYLNPLKDLNENVDTIVYHSKNEKSNNDDDNDTRSVLGKQEFNFKKVISQMGAMLSYVKSGGYGHTFKGIVKDKNGKEKYSFAVKMVAYSKKEDYGDEYNLQRPENAELCMLKVLSYFVLKKMSPHIILPISTFYTDIKPFLTLQEKGIIDKNNTNYKEFIVATDRGIFYKMQQAAPKKLLMEAPTAGHSATCRSCAHCPWMAMNDLDKIEQVLLHGHNEITIDVTLQQRALKPLKRLMDFAAVN